MDDIDRVFARFKDDKPEPANRRETLRGCLETRSI